VYITVSVVGRFRLAAAAVVNAVDAGIAGAADAEGGETSGDTAAVVAAAQAQLDL